MKRMKRDLVLVSEIPSPDRKKLTNDTYLFSPSPDEKATQPKPTNTRSKTTWQQALDNCTHHKRRKMYGCFNITPSRENIEKLIDEADMAVIQRKLRTAVEELNPFNINNFHEKKKIIADHIESLDEPQKLDLLAEVSDCKDHGELFSLFKEHEFLNRLDICNDSKMFSVLKESYKKDVYIDDALEEYKKFKEEKIFTKRDLLDRLIPRSSKAEVLKLEEEIRSLGVREINLSDDLEGGINLKKAIEAMIKARGSIPHAYYKNPLKPLRKGGSVELLLSPDKRTYLVPHMELHAVITTRQEILEAARAGKRLKSFPDDVKRVFIGKIEEDFKDIDSYKNGGTIFHESEHYRTNYVMRYFYARHLTDEELELARSVSIYAADADDISELRAEIFRKLMHGHRISDELMSWYIRNDGTVPEFD
jgi:hypothetical protein